jgi:hypothetical protein
MAKLDTGKGRCDTCGFLVLRFWTDTGLYEATQEYREKGADEGLSGSLSRPPLCLVQAARIDLEVEANIKATAGSDMSIGPPSIVAVIQKPDRRCSMWRQWIPGFTPKEHRELLDRERQLKWQTEESRRNRNYRLIELVLVIFTIGAILVAAFIERSSQPTIIINTSDQPSVTQGTQSGEQSTPGSNAP